MTRKDWPVSILVYYTRVCMVLFSLATKKTYSGSNEKENSIASIRSGPNSESENAECVLFVLKPNRRMIQKRESRPSPIFFRGCPLVIHFGFPIPARYAGGLSFGFQPILFMDRHVIIRFSFAPLTFSLSNSSSAVTLYVVSK
jgi:hypothetical protein